MKNKSKFTCFFLLLVVLQFLLPTILFSAQPDFPCAKKLHKAGRELKAQKGAISKKPIENVVSSLPNTITKTVSFLAKKDTPKEQISRPTPTPKTKNSHQIIKRFETFKDYRYCKVLLPSWGKEGRYLYLCYHKNVSLSSQLTVLLYFHGMHSRDYHRSFAHEMRKATANTKKHLVFAGVIDMPRGRGNWKNRWQEFDKKMGEGPELLYQINDELDNLIKDVFPRAKNFSLCIAGHSGGHRVLDNLSWMLLNDEGEKAARDRLLARLTKIFHFDVWYSATVVKYIPKFLEKFPKIKLYSTINHSEPRIHARKIITQLKLDTVSKGYWKNAIGNLKIRDAISHWGAFRDRFVWAVED